jgi:hypothetical protein
LAAREAGVEVEAFEAAVEEGGGEQPVVRD